MKNDNYLLKSTIFSAIFYNAYLLMRTPSVIIYSEQQLKQFESL